MGGSPDITYLKIVLDAPILYIGAIIAERSINNWTVSKLQTKVKKIVQGIAKIFEISHRKVQKYIILYHISRRYTGLGV